MVSGGSEVRLPLRPGASSWGTDVEHHAENAVQYEHNQAFRNGRMIGSPECFLVFATAADVFPDRLSQFYAFSSEQSQLIWGKRTARGEAREVLDGPSSRKVVQ
ncbi:hypothetical protein J3458_011741 [Metarhizium acridum]|uniref:uncharacterized protein n=1 Tax=Metarhizium acridum TaxID=92637 RepID=UPI001C6C6B59|nr:hypothetical protein J3458_011741 [Metarhizium acridum]